jgi:hypothetical protein
MSGGGDAPEGGSRWRRLLFGAPRNLHDRRLFHAIALTSLLAWVGLGADGLSSSAYGPEEAYRTLGEHKYLALALAGLTATTVFLIAAGYSRIIERFPLGGGGYVVASSLLGSHAGVVSGCALIVDYVLTITISIAAAGDALFSFVPATSHEWRLMVDFAAITVLIILNIRGVRESVTVLTPIFVVFCVTHAIVIIGGIVTHIPDIPDTARRVSSDFSTGLATIGIGGMLVRFMHAYSLGGGTYTGIEAVSNGLQVMREPRVQNGKRTMLLMAASLAFTASGLLILYLLLDVQPVDGRTLNAVLIEQMTRSVPGGVTFAFVTILSEGALLVVAAQAGFMDGPRVLATMAVDSWLPRRFSALSERLTTQNGVLLMGIAALAALLYTGGDVRKLVVLYSINVFMTFCLSLFGMLRATFRAPPTVRSRSKDLALFGAAFGLCAIILCVTVYEKFFEGGWLTLIITGSLVALCFWIRRHYQAVVATLNRLYVQLEKLPPAPANPPPPLDPRQPTAVLLVGGYGGLGIHTFGNIFRAFPGIYRNVVFVSIGVVDSGEFKGENSVAALGDRMQSQLNQYLELARRFGVAATSRMALGTDVVAEAEKLCLETAAEFPRSTFFAGKVIFRRESWYHRLLHNEMALAVQKRLQWAGHVMVILPARIA